MKIADRLKIASKALFGRFKANSTNYTGGYRYFDVTGQFQDSFFFNFGDTSTERALKEGYTNFYYFAIIHDLANRMVGLPWVIYDQEENEIENLQVDELFSNPNDYEKAYQFWYRVFANVLMGDCFIVSPQSAMLINEMPFGSLICPITSNVDVNYVNGLSSQISNYSITYRNTSLSVPASQVLQLSVPNLYTDNDLDRGFGAIKAAMPSWEVSTGQLRTQGGAYKNVGANKLIAADGQLAMLPQERKEVQDFFDQLVYGYDNVGKTKVVSSNMKAVDIGFAPKDYMFSEANEIAIQQACLMMGVSPVLYGSTKASTYNNIASADEDRLNMLVNKADVVYKNMTKWLMEFGNVGLEKGQYICVNKSAVPDLSKPNLEYMRESKAILEAYNQGNMTQNQARIQLQEFDYSDSQIDEMLS